MYLKIPLIYIVTYSIVYIWSINLFLLNFQNIKSKYHVATCIFLPIENAICRNPQISCQNSAEFDLTRWLKGAKCELITMWGFHSFYVLNLTQSLIYGKMENYSEVFMRKQYSIQNGIRIYKYTWNSCWPYNDF